MRTQIMRSASFLTANSPTLTNKLNVKEMFRVRNRLTDKKSKEFSYISAVVDLLLGPFAYKDVRKKNENCRL